MATVTSVSRPSIPRTAGNPCDFHSSSTARRKNRASNSFARKLRAEVCATQPRRTKQIARKGNDIADAPATTIGAIPSQGYLVTETTRSYEHPGITDPVTEEQSSGTVAFAKSAVPSAANFEGAESSAETVDLAKEFAAAGIE